LGGVAPPRKLLTIDLHIHYLAAGFEEDLVAEGWVRRRGRSTAFVSAEVESASGTTLATGQMAYRIVS
jgi:acyl-coenzyme A thioesterase PaaI-like protein